MTYHTIIRTDLHDYAERIVSGTADMGLISAREREEWTKAAQYLLDTGDAEDLQYLIDREDAAERFTEDCWLRGVQDDPPDFDEDYWLAVTASEASVPGRAGL